MAYKILHREWPFRRSIYYLMGAELVCLIPILVLFGISQPDLWRSKFWQIGFENGWNSNPNMVVYAHANYRPVPKIPFVWSRSSTDYNVALSVITLFVLLSRMIAFIMHYWFPIIAVVVNVIMTTLWCVSIYAQVGPDNADPRYPSPIVWYIKKPCSVVKSYDEGTVHLCQLAKSAFAVTVLMLVVSLANLGLSIHAMISTKNDAASNTDDEELSTRSGSGEKETSSWEMQRMQSPSNETGSEAAVFTPRTAAFNTLNRPLPLRAS